MAKAPHCSVCRHPEVLKINAALSADKPNLTKIAIKFGLGRMSVTRHRTDCVPVLAAPPPDAAAIEQEIAASLPDGASPREKMDALYARVEGLMSGAERKKDYSTAIKAARELRGFLELSFKLSGEIDQTVTVFSGPIWLTVQTNIIAALEPYPDARAAVLRALASP